MTLFFTYKSLIHSMLQQHTFFLGCSIQKNYVICSNTCNLTEYINFINLIKSVIRQTFTFWKCITCHVLNYNIYFKTTNSCDHPWTFSIFLKEDQDRYQIHNIYRSKVMYKLPDSINRCHCYHNACRSIKDCCIIRCDL